MGVMGSSQDFSVASVADLLDASDEKDLVRRLQRTAHRLEFEQFVLGVEIDRPLTERLQHVASGYPAAWQRTYQQQNYIALDPTVHHCRAHDTPLVWTDDLRQGASAAFWEEARSHGIVHGISIPTHESAYVTGMISLARDKPLPADAAEFARMYAASRVVSACAHVAASRVLLPALLARGRPRLTKREKDCMAWAASGLTAREIAAKMNISVATVVFHCNKVVAKLNVRNRMQAAALSVALGLVQP